MYEQYLSPTFVRQFKKLPKDAQHRIQAALFELKMDPYNRRSGLAIRRLEGFHPKRLRVRVGNYRVVYQVEGNVIEVFPRGRGYRFELF